MRRGRKVGGIIDRRFGENDPSMTPEQRAAERFARESQRRQKKSSIFNLEDDEEGGVQLTHMGKALSAGDNGARDDFAGSDLDNSEDDAEVDERPGKKRRLSVDGPDELPQREENMDLLPETKKSRQEIMKEVIGKSKLHKYERQQVKEDDDELRAELDQGLPDFLEAMRKHNPSVRSIPATGNGPSLNPDREALLNGKDRKEADREYNERVRQMALDQRSKPSDRTKTEEEKAAEEAARLQEMEKERLRRMQGQPESSGDDSEVVESNPDDADEDDAEVFGLNMVNIGRKNDERKNLDVEDENEFIIDDELIDEDFKPELAPSDVESSPSLALGLEEEEDDFVDGLTLPENDHGSAHFESGATNGSIAYTYPCPTSHEELLQITQQNSIQDLPIIIQRIRALYHPKLDSSNKDKLEKFGAVLVEHIAYLTKATPRPPTNVLDGVIRHVHSLAKSYPNAIGTAFLIKLKEMSDLRPLKLLPQDLILLTSISTIFPTSDHFHCIVTPSILTIARYLGQSLLGSLHDLVIGAYCCSLALQYQSVAKRYVPEVMNYLLNGLLHLAPSAPGRTPTCVIYREPIVSLRIQQRVETNSSPINFWTILDDKEDPEEAKVAVAHNLLTQLRIAADTWQSKSAFPEIVEPAITTLSHLDSKSNSRYFSTPLKDSICDLSKYLSKLQRCSLDARKPLFLHNHRPLPIKTSIPKFEDSYNPRRFNDPDRERAQLNKLRAEHKRERKGAMRELRKDANFVARETLREKKEKDAAYEQKFQKLIAQIQGEEGKEANEYEREKRKRKGKF